MFEKKDIIEFLTKIIEKANSDNAKDTKQSISKYKEYLELTTMCDEDTIASIDKVVDCLEELITIKEKTGICNIEQMFNKYTDKDTSKKEEKAFVKVKERKFEEPYQEKHYDRYVPVSYDSYSSCGSSRHVSYGSSCGSSGSSSYGSGC